MGTEEKVADAASKKQGRPCMEVALRLPSYPPTQPTHPPRSSVFVPRCLQAMERPGRPLFSLSGLIVVVLHVRSLCSTPGVAAGGAGGVSLPCRGSKTYTRGGGVPRPARPTARRRKSP